jgi:hypothetical protein
MKFEMRYFTPDSAIIEANSVEEAAAEAAKFCKTYGCTLIGVASPAAWAKIYDEDTPRLPPRNTPPSGTPGNPPLQIEFHYTDARAA